MVSWFILLAFDYFIYRYFFNSVDWEQEKNDEFEERRAKKSKKVKTVKEKSLLMENIGIFSCRVLMKMEMVIKMMMIMKRKKTIK